MLFGKKGVSAGVKVVFAFLALVAIIGIWSYIANNGISFSSSSYSIEPILSVAEVTNLPWLGFLDYIVGGVPNFLVGLAGEQGAFIVMLSIFTILLLTFSDIMITFGSFSEEWISWTVGSLLTIIAVNLKWPLAIAAWSFGITASLGALSVAFGLLVPFILYFVANILILSNVKDYFKARRDESQAQKIISRARQDAGYIRGLKTLAKGSMEENE